MNFNVLNYPLNKRSLIIAIAIAILVAGNVFFGVSYFLGRQQAKASQKQLNAQQENKKIITFLNVFIEKVLKADREVSFEDRLKLENTVRDLGDRDILSQWEKFTGSSSEAQVQVEVKNLLSLLVKKINN